MKRYAKVIVLGEDRAHRNFIRHYLKKRGFNHRQIHVRRQGSGKQFVLENYATEVKAYRSQANHLSHALVTVIDADTQKVRDIHRCLEKRLQGDSIHNRQTDERIAVLVPKRNIETWMVYLLGSTVDEEKNYKEHQLAKDPQAPKRAGITLARQLGQEPGADCPQSLQAAGSELKDRLPGQR